MADSTSVSRPGLPTGLGLKRAHTIAMSMAVLSVAAFVGSPYLVQRLVLPRTEELSYSLFPLVLWARQLLQGVVPQWQPALGLGVPWPIPHTMSHTPFVWLFAVLPVFSALAVLVVGHSVFQGYYVLRLARDQRWSLVVTLVVLVTVMLGAPLEYLLQSDAAAVFVAWTLLPGILYYVTQLLASEATWETTPRRLITAAIALGLIVGYGVLNTHLGMFLSQVLGVSVLAVLQPARLWERRYLVALSIVVAVAVGAEKISMFANELRYFPNELVRLQYGAHGSTLHSVWNLLARPLVVGDFAGSLQAATERVVTANLVSRTLTFGCFVFGWIVLAACLSLRRIRTSKARALVTAAFIINFLLSFLPKALLPSLLSASWTFRDPAMLFGVILAADYCDRVLRPRLSRPLLLGLLGIQVLGALGSGFVFLYGNQLLPSIGGHSVQQYNALASTISVTKLDSLLREAMRCEEADKQCAELSRRYVLSGAAMMSAERGLDVDAGLLTNVGSVRGFEDVSAVAKGISLDTIHPSQSLPYGLITGDGFRVFRLEASDFDWTRDNRALLDLLGIRAVVGTVTTGRAACPQVGLLRTEPRGETPIPLAVFRNPDAFPRAFFVDPSALDHATRRPGCSAEHSLTCLDVAAVTPQILPWQDPIHVEGTGDRILLRVTPHARSRTALVSVMWRPEWSASAHGTPVGVKTQWGLLRLEVPPNVTEVELLYHSAVQNIARVVTLLGGGASLFTVAGLVIARKRSLRTTRNPGTLT